MLRDRNVMVHVVVYIVVRVLGLIDLGRYPSATLEKGFARKIVTARKFAPGNSVNGLLNSPAKGLVLDGPVNYMSAVVAREMEVPGFNHDFVDRGDGVRVRTFFEKQ